MSLPWPTARSARGRAACALMLTCVLIPLASARQSQTTSADAAKKPAANTNSSSPGTKSTSGTKSTTHNAKHSSHKKKSSRPRGQQKIDSERAQAIQAALIREHYLTGEPSATWNEASEEAMRRYQSDHGWQTKEVPDSRALISLGLGPSHDHLLNPESAMTTGPAQPRSTSSASAAHGTDAGTTNKIPTPPVDRPAATPAQDTSHPQ
jgi:hypothetical protein